MMHRTIERQRFERLARSVGWSGLVTLGVAVVAAAVSGCASASAYVSTEASYWGAFTKVVEGPLQPGINSLPASIRERHCYRVILASTGGQGQPLLRFQGEIDSDSVGFPILPVPIRGQAPGDGSIAVYGFCSQGSGTVQLQTNMPGPGFGALYEAAYGSLDASQGPDVTAVAQWLARRQQEEAARQAEAQRQAAEAARRQFAETTAPALRERIATIARNRGRYTTTILDEVRSVPESREALVLEPGLCYFFGVLPYDNTQVMADLTFARIRNAASRTDTEGAITYTVCAAPHGPVQEVALAIMARTPPGAPNPPTFAVYVANRAGSSTERRAADQEWLANDPEARIER
jgi:hypothetical protein